MSSSTRSSTTSNLNWDKNWVNGVKYSGSPASISIRNLGTEHRKPSFDESSTRKLPSGRVLVDRRSLHGRTGQAGKTHRKLEITFANERDAQIVVSYEQSQSIKRLAEEIVRDGEQLQKEWEDWLKEQKQMLLETDAMRFADRAMKWNEWRKRLNKKEADLAQRMEKLKASMN